MPYAVKPPHLGPDQFLCPECQQSVVTREKRYGRPPSCADCKERSRLRRLRVQAEKRWSGEWDSHLGRKDGVRYDEKNLPDKTFHCVECSSAYVRKRRPRHGLCPGCLLVADKAARADKERERRRRDPEISFRTNLDRNLRRFGLATNWYDTAEKRCGICGADTPAGQGRWHFDHDHACCQGGCPSCFRGLLCHYCNIGLGNFNDDPESMRLAAEWVERHRASP